jgi:hypothetical protein
MTKPGPQAQREGGAMEISELIQKLETIMAEHGDIYAENAKGTLVTVEVVEIDGQATVVIS